MHPSAPRSSRSSVHSLALSTTPVPSPSPSQSPSPTGTLPLTQQQQQQQQQQHILYGPITTLQSCNAPPCIYPASNQRGTAGTSNPAALHASGKSTKWNGKSKVQRGQYCSGQATQSAHISYPGKPLVLYDQTQSGTPVSGSSFLLSSSTFSHSQFPSEHYNNTGLALVPPPYFKPPEVQTFCLVQDRQTAPQHNSYYNISATNTCSLQAVNSASSFQLPSLTPYAVTAFPNNQIAAAVPVQSTQIFQTAPVSLVFGPPHREKHAVQSSNLDVTVPSKCVRNKLPVVGNTKAHAISNCLQKKEWPPSPARPAASSSPAVDCINPAHSSDAGVAFDGCKSPRNVSYKSPTITTSLKNPEDRYSDESSASFDFTIEAEKMVSALCNTASSNDLGGASGKDEVGKTDTSYFNGAGDNVGNKGNWFADFEMDYSTNGGGGGGGCKAVGTQTEPNQGFAQQLPELIRKTAYWGCTEAETILNSPKYQYSNQAWLSNISAATRTAITKSSTCFPVFAGDRTFVHDLINALLRITNGWLILDNYLNKQHYPNLTEKFDAELARCFQGWEGNTHELLRNVIQTFLKLDETSLANFNSTSTSLIEPQNGSFPGDISMYTTSDIFVPPLNNGCQNRTEDNFLSGISSLRRSQESAYAVHYAPQSSGAQNFRYFNPQGQTQKETKPRSKWTITENVGSATDGVKSVPDIFVTHSESGFSGSKFRAKGTSTLSAKSSSRQSLNAEFFNLRNKVMESNCELGKQWNINADSRKKADFLFVAKNAGGTESVYTTTSYTGLAPMCPTKTLDTGGTTKTCLQGIDSVFQNSKPQVEDVYLGTSSIGGDLKTEKSKNSKCRNQNLLGRMPQSGIDSDYLEKISTEKLNLATVPKNKITLLSQIEPSATPKKETQEMTANLTAWFASMRTPNSILSTCSENRLSESFKSLHHQESSRSMIDITRQLQMDPNRQLQTLKNMQSIQSAPWNACNLINRQTNVQQVEEYDSSEDVRVYMKPGSYNVPKKRHQRRLNKRTENLNVAKNPGIAVPHNNYPPKDKVESSGSGTNVKIPIPPVPVLSTPSFPLENSPRLVRRIDSSSSQDYAQDITWQAACASAEILLEALNVKQDQETGVTEDSKISSELNANPKCEEGGASSYEASEDDSGSTCKLSSPDTQSKEIKVNKTNVKTDSWLIRTLNNANIKQRHEPNLDSSESSNSSVNEDELGDGNALEKLDANLRRSQESRDEYQPGDSAEGIARATYSETVRRSASNHGVKEPCRSRPQKTPVVSGTSCAGNSTTGKKSQRKETERSCLVHKSRKSISKKANKDGEIPQGESNSVKPKLSKEELARFPPLKTHAKRKDSGAANSGENGKNKNGDRGWSVWYSSRRRQSLSPMACSKLETIRQAIWQMAEAEMIKYPPSSSMAVRSSAESIEDYYKIIKSPMFLDTIGYKLKNKIYHKVEQVIRDFRKIIFNSRVYHKSDAERMVDVEILSKKLDNLFDEHFTNWDFENITGSPRDGNGSPIPSRCKPPPTQKPQRSSNSKKSHSTNADSTNVTH